MASGRKVVIVGAIVALLALTVYVSTRSPSASPGKVDAPRILAAAREYTRLFMAQHLPVPASVNVDELISRGLLRPEDVAGFAGAEVSVSLKGDPRDPHTVLMRAKFKDGKDLLLLADGSVQQVPSPSK